jgi:LacI family transcriptional regulator
VADAPRARPQARPQARTQARPQTIADVAARAGVSLATVSRVMNGNATVDPGLADRVRAAAAELGYSASPLARSLASGRTSTIAVLVPDLENPTFQGVLRGLNRAAVRDGYHVMVADTTESLREERVLAVETRRRCDGLVLVAPRMPDEELRTLLGRLEPVVLVNRDVGVPGVPLVAADYGSALAELLELVHAQGHRSLVFLAGAPQSASNAQRLQAVRGFLDTHADATVAVLPCGVTFADGYAAVDRVRGSGATAVLAFNDLVAMGLLSGLHEQGVRVPAELSVVGFDDIPFARYLVPPLTTAAVPVVELGEEAWRRMRDLLDQRPAGPPVVLRPRVERRGSAGPVAAGDEAGR